MTMTFTSTRGEAPAVGIEAALAAGLAPDGGLYVGASIPRWQGDTNFLPVIGQTRILPQALETTWEKLTAGVPTLRAQLAAR